MLQLNEAIMNLSSKTGNLVSEFGDLKPRNSEKDQGGSRGDRGLGGPWWSGLDQEPEQTDSGRSYPVM